jgi:hypothetical protein
MHRISCLLLALCLLAQAAAQPLWNEKKMVGSTVVFPDIKVKNKYYYGPRPLELSRDPEGKPLFQLTSMRYTGRQLTGDKAEKRFTNLLQWSVTLPPTRAEDLKALSEALHLPANANLQPLPIRNLEATLVSGVGEGLGDDRLVKRASMQSEENNGKSVYWTARNFVMPLDNAEAQLLADQFKNGRIAVSLNYAFFADVQKITEETLELKGDSAFVAAMQNAAGELQRDTVDALEVAYSNVLDIGIDAAQYPAALKQIDLNENAIPPAYPSLEVKCYDFVLGTRPDLAYKRVFVEGTSVNGQPVQEKIKFSKGQRDLSTQYVSFRYALRMDKPLRYKVVEGGTDAEETSGSWITLEQFTNLIDASTTQKKGAIRQRCLEVEVLEACFSETSTQQIKVIFLYTLYGKQLAQSIDFQANDEMLLKPICLTHDAGQPLRYVVSRQGKSGTGRRSIVRTVAVDDYVLVGK